MTERWQDQSLCAQTDPETFFPNTGEKDKVKIAKKICAMCDVFDECEVETLLHPPDFGIQAGMTVKEIRKRNKRDNQ